MPVVGKRHHIRHRRRAHLHHAADVQPIQPGGRRLRLVRVNLQRLFARLVAHQHQTPVVEPDRAAITHAVTLPRLHDRPLVGKERIRFAPRRQRDHMPVRVQVIAVQIAGGADKLAVPLDARAVIPHLDADVLVGGRGIHKEVGPGVIDDAPPIRRRVADIVIVVVGVTLQLAPVGAAAIEVADAFVVADKIDVSRTVVVVQPHGRRQVARQIRQQPHEIAVAVGVHPKLPRRAPAIPLPARRVAGVAP